MQESFPNPLTLFKHMLILKSRIKTKLFLKREVNNILNEINNIQIGNRIKKIRRDKGLTTEEFALIFDPPASKGTVSKWENGKYLPNNSRLVEIADLGGISVDELLYGDSQARIKKILLDKPGVNEDLIEFVINYFINTNNEYAREEDIFVKYDEIAENVNSTVEKRIAQNMLAYYIRHSEELLFDFLKDSPKDLDYNNVNLALSELSNAAGNYETYFDKTIDEVYNEIIKMQEEEK